MIRKVGTTSFTGKYPITKQTIQDVGAIAMRKAGMQNKIAALQEQLKTAPKKEIPIILKQIRNLQGRIINLEEEAFRAIP